MKVQLVGLVLELSLAACGGEPTGPGGVHVGDEISMEGAEHVRPVRLDRREDRQGKRLGEWLGESSPVQLRQAQDRPERGRVLHGQELLSQEVARPDQGGGAQS